MNFKNKIFIFFVFILLITIISKLNQIITNFIIKTNQKTPQLTNESKKLNFSLPSPTLESIFSLDHSWTATLSAQSTISLFTTGDVIPARSVNFQSHQHQDFTWSWQFVADFLKTADITLINLESPLISNCPITNEGMIFCADAKHIQGLKLAGIDIANIANNHYANYGQNGVEESNQLLTDNQIAITGYNNIVYKIIKNKIIAFLGYNEIEHINDNLSSINEDKIKQDIDKAKQTADLIVVSYHWGAEYKSQPETYRIQLAHQTIDWGADLIIGNHPHWIQPVEIYKNKVITYAHGNFIFDQEWSTETKQGVIGQYLFFNNQIVDVKFIPVFISNYGQVKFADDSLSLVILNKMYQQSLTLQDSLTN